MLILVIPPSDSRDSQTAGRLPARLPVCSHTRDVTLDRYGCHVNSSSTATAASVSLAVGLRLSTSEGFKRPRNDCDLSVYLNLFQNDVGLYLTFPLEKPGRTYLFVQTKARLCAFALKCGSYIGVACSILFVV